MQRNKTGLSQGVSQHHTSTFTSPFVTQVSPYYWCNDDDDDHDAELKYKQVSFSLKQSTTNVTIPI